MPNQVGIVTVEDAGRKPESAMQSAVSRPRSCAFWSMFRFIKETYVWLVWIPLLLIGLGIAMNFLAVTMNHGIMPVVLPSSGAIAEKDKMHVAATAHTRFLVLCDWIPLYAGVASPGDYLIRAGDFLKWPLVWMWVGFISQQVKGQREYEFLRHIWVWLTKNPYFTPSQVAHNSLELPPC